MVPGIWVEMESFPLLPNGKVDKRSLPDPETSEQGSGQYVAPATETQSKMAALWQDVLEVEQVGIHDNFFELGGHSLLAVRLISVIRKEFSAELPISEIFDYPTVSLLSERIQQKPGTAVLPTIIAQQRPEHIPLSFSQERLWFIDQLEGSVQYHRPTVLRLIGRVDKEALNKTLKEIVNRHEVLRTIIREENGVAFQIIKEKNTFQLSLDVTYSHSNKELLQRHVEKLIQKPFDLSSDDMMRASLISLSDQEHLLILVIHHIASDGWSISIAVKEIIELYASFTENRSPGLPSLPVQYADFAIYQRNPLREQAIARKLEYWKNQLHGMEPISLPTDFPRPAIQSRKGAFAAFSISAELSNKLQQLSRQHETTLFMTLLSALKILLYRYSGQADICVGTPIAGRQQHELESLIGFFINTLAIRNEVDGNSSFTDLLLQGKTNYA